MGRADVQEMHQHRVRPAGAGVAAHLVAFAADMGVQPVIHGRERELLPQALGRDGDPRPSREEALREDTLGR